MSIICTKKVDNTKNACRVCLKTSSSYYEFSTYLDLQKMSGPSFADAIKEVLAMECFDFKDSDPNVVNLICSLCAEELKTAYRFLQKARNTQKIIRPAGSDSVDVYQEMDDVEVKTEHESIDRVIIPDPLNVEQREEETTSDVEEVPLADPNFHLFIEDSTAYSIKEEDDILCSPSHPSFDKQLNEVIMNPPYEIMNGKTFSCFRLCFEFARG